MLSNSVTAISVGRIIPVDSMGAVEWIQLAAGTVLVSAVMLKRLTDGSESAIRE